MTKERTREIARLWNRENGVQRSAEGCMRDADGNSKKSQAGAGRYVRDPPLSRVVLRSASPSGACIPDYQSTDLQSAVLLTNSISIYHI